ncbi:MAG TPA: PEGA domain-containing protein [Pirellulales bacterium]|nr:PEGA domain-containing protein [Pirellulales bacterium]
MKKAKYSASFCFALLLAISAGGCVQRRITVRSNPPGALVYIDKHEIGRTPCSVEYIYYGTREIKLIKDGFETLTVLQWIPPPWYEIPGIDFFTESVVPFEIRDERTFNYQLVPTRVVPTNQLLGRAENLRQATKFERMMAAPPVPPPAARPRMLPPPQPTMPLGPPPGGRGFYVQPGGAPTPGFAPAPGYGAPGYYPPPGMAPAPELLPSPGPMPPRGPQ